jgi:regulatory protein
MNEQSRKTGNYVITAIAPNKKGQMVVSFGTRKLLLSPNAFTEMPLYVGKELSGSEFHSLALFNKNEALRNYALSLASKGAYSVHDVRAKLRLKSQDEAAIRSILISLKEQGLLDDQGFAKEYKEEKEKQLYGKERILSELKFKHGIRDEIVNKLVFKDEAAHAEKAAEILEKKFQRYPLAKKKEKGALALIRRGYDPLIAHRAVSHYHDDASLHGKTLKTLCEKTLKRYGAKYNGYQLRSKVFAYLMSKGYSSDEVERVLEETL